MKNSRPPLLLKNKKAWQDLQGGGTESRLTYAALLVRGEIRDPSSLVTYISHDQESTCTEVLLVCSLFPSGYQLPSAVRWPMPEARERKRVNWPEFCRLVSKFLGRRWPREGTGSNHLSTSYLRACRKLWPFGNGALRVWGERQGDMW